MTCRHADIAEEAANHPLLRLADAWLDGVAPDVDVLRAAIPEDPLLSPGSGPSGPEALLRLSAIEWAFRRRFGFSIPTPGMVADLARSGPWIEVGAGTGFLARLVSNAGGDVVATDIVGSGEGTRYGAVAGAWHPVSEMAAEDAVEAHPDRGVLMSWPGLDNRWPRRVVDRIGAGRVLAYVGEWRGCCAEPDFFKELERRFACVRHLDVLNFPRMNDLGAILQATD